MVVAAIAFGLAFLTELVDTSGLATLVLGTRFPARWVLLGVGAGMVVHVGLAVVAGGLVALLPGRLLESLLAVTFLVGAVLIWRGDDDADEDDERVRAATASSPWRVVATGFGVTVLSEVADPSQIVIATLTARYHDPVAVGVGSLLALWAVSALAVYAGDRLQRWVPVRWVTRATAAILVALGVISAIDALGG